jgi:hypothetical protein
MGVRRRKDCRLRCSLCLNGEHDCSYSKTSMVFEEHMVILYCCQARNLTSMISLINLIRQR